MTTPATFDSTNAVANLQVLSFDKAFARYMPNGTAPLFALTSELPSETIPNIQHGYFTKTMIFPSVQLNGAIGSGATTTFTVDDSSSVIPGQLLRAQSTGEVVRVTGVTNATTITVARGVGNVAAAAIADNVVLYGIGNAFEEASTRPQAQRLTQSYVQNYTQIFRNTWLLSGTQANIQTIAGDGHVAEDKADCMALHAADIEKALFWGQKYIGTVNNQSFHTMDGLESTIRVNAASNISTAGGTTTYDQLETMLDVCFNVQTDPKVGNKRVLFVGATALKVINKIGRLSGTMNFTEGATAFGLQFTKFRITRGEFIMIEHPLFNSNADWAKMAVAVDLSTIRLGYLQGRKTRHDYINQNGATVDNSLDAVGGVLLSELTFICRNPSANAIIYGLTAAA